MGARLGARHRSGQREDHAVDGVRGWLVEERDVDKMSRRILEMAEDHRLRAQIGSEARKFVISNFFRGRCLSALTAAHSAYPTNSMKPHCFWALSGQKGGANVMLGASCALIPRCYFAALSLDFRTVRIEGRSSFPWLVVRLLALRA